jgi:hypothetical protein
MNQFKQWRGSHGNIEKVFRVLLRNLRYRGRVRYCNICGRSSRKFLHFGSPPSPDRACPFCGSLERHRCVMLWLQSTTPIGPFARVLHVAPEPFLRQTFKALARREYLTTDLNAPDVDVRCSLESIPLPDNSFDLIYCSSVLQFVPNDELALCEIHRILRVGGMALLSVPIHESARSFSAQSGSRCYDESFQGSVESIGFSVSKVSGLSFVGLDECVRLGLREPDNHPLFVATKR